LFGTDTLRQAFHTIFQNPRASLGDKLKAAGVAGLTLVTDAVTVGSLFVGEPEVGADLRTFDEGLLAADDAKAAVAATSDGALLAADDAEHTATTATGAYMGGATGGEGFGKLAGRAINVSKKGLALVMDHLAQFGDNPDNDAMLGRLRSALADGSPIMGADASFYMHEANEATLMGRGMDYESAHAAALAKYGVSPYSVYAPEVIQAFPERFGPRWFEFWGIDR
jgi:hypothetical protein